MAIGPFPLPSFRAPTEPSPRRYGPAVRLRTRWRRNHLDALLGAPRLAGELIAALRSADGWVRRHRHRGVRRGELERNADELCGESQVKTGAEDERS